MVYQSCATPNERAMRILVAADSFMPVDYFSRAFAGLAIGHEITYFQVDADRPFGPVTASARKVREYQGSPDELVERIPGSEILIVHGAPVTEEVLDAAGSIRLVCCARGGPVNVDVEALTSRGVPLVNTPGKNAEAVADLTLAFMVMLARGLPEAQRVVADGHQPQDTFEGARFIGSDLRGHVLGLVGFGEIGRRVAERSRGFGTAVLVYDPYVKLDGSFEQVEKLDELLARSDFVSLHARATSDNENLIDEAALQAMKPGGYLVNTARETLVDEDALDAALSSGHLAGAALDVVRLPRVPAVGPHPLLRHENVVLTPHVGGATHETLLQGAEMIADEVSRFVCGEPLIHVISWQGVAA
jgi:D-3-phosphoglycerate dehydrogenase / 2-oxoglutarate reductase